MPSPDASRASDTPNVAVHVRGVTKEFGSGGSLARALRAPLP